MIHEVSFNSIFLCRIKRCWYGVNWLLTKHIIYIPWVHRCDSYSHCLRCTNSWAGTDVSAVFGVWCIDLRGINNWLHPKMKDWVEIFWNSPSPPTTLMFLGKANSWVKVRGEFAHDIHHCAYSSKWSEFLNQQTSAGTRVNAPRTSSLWTDWIQTASHDREHRWSGILS